MIVHSAMASYDSAMSMPQRKSLLTPADYLRMERGAELRHEYFNGEVFAMSGGSPNHSLIKTKVTTELCTRLKGRRCTVYDSDLRVKVEASGLYTYPAASVVCGELEFDDAQRDTILNPTLLVEVLSPSTEAYDRGKKSLHYRKIELLREYLLISQDEPRVERFLRNAEGTWTLTEVAGLDARLHLPSLDIEVSLAEIFNKVDFQAVG